MFITTREIVCFGKKVKAFQPIPRPEKWDKVALHSCLSVGWVKEVSDSEAKKLKIHVGPPEPHLPPKKKKGKKKPEASPENALQCKCGREFGSKRALTTHRNRSHRS